MGTALAHRLRGAGYPVAAVISRSARSAKQLAAAVDADTASKALTALPRRVALLFLCVPDDQVRPVAQALAAHEHPWRRALVAHTSGVLPAAALHPLAEAGATTLSFHPLQAFAPATPPEAFDGIYVGLEGGTDALAAGEALAEALGARALPLSKASKTRYHLAASMASNFLVTLMALADDVLEEAASDSRGIDGADWLRPLVEGTLQNLGEAAPAAALTGPIARGDEDTVAAHLKALRARHPGLLPVYAALASETVRLAARTDRLAPATADRLLEQLSDALQQQPQAASDGGWERSNRLS